jgi:hypothetical protein
MKKHILAVCGIAGLLLGSNPADVFAREDVLVAYGGSTAPEFAIDTRPDFIYLDDYGFYTSYGSPYDMIFLDNSYFLFWEGIWYYSPFYYGPWVVIRDYDLPYRIRMHRWHDIRRYRDTQYGRHDRRYWDNIFERDRVRFNQPRNRDRNPGPGEGFGHPGQPSGSGPGGWQPKDGPGPWQGGPGGHGGPAPGFNPGPGSFGPPSGHGSGGHRR